MKRFAGWVVGATMTLSATVAGAGGIDVASYGYALPGTTLVDEAPADIYYDGLVDFFDATALFGDLNVSYFPSDPAPTAVLDYIPLPGVLTPATEVSVMTDFIELLFEDSGMGFLVTVDATTPTYFDDFTGQGLDFTNPLAAFIAGGTISVDKYSTAVIPLPATLPLVLAGLGGLAFFGRRKSKPA